MMLQFLKNIPPWSKAKAVLWLVSAEFVIALNSLAMHHGLVTETAFFVIAIASGLAGVSGSFHLGRRFGFGLKQGGGLNALVLGEVGEEALETLRWERDSALEAAAPADVGRV